MEVTNTNVPGQGSTVDERETQMEQPTEQPAPQEQPKEKTKSEDPFDVGSWIKEFEEDIKKEEAQKRTADIQEKKDIAKQLYSKFRDELSKEQQTNSELKTKIEEMEKRLSNLSSGSKTRENEPNPFQEPAKPDFSKDKTALAKKAAQQLGVRMFN